VPLRSGLPRLGTRALPALLAVAALLLPTVPAAHGASAADAQEQAELLGLEVVTGYGGPPTLARWLPVEVALQPVRPLTGVLELVVRGPAGITTYARDIEVAASSRSVFRFVVPAGSVTARFVEQGAEPAEIGVQGDAAGEGFLVGMLGEPPPSAPPVRQETTGRTGTWVGVDPEWLDLSAAALEPLGSLVAELGALEGLGEDALANLAAAVVAGTDLVVVADRDGPVDLAALGLPAGPQVAAAAVPGLADTRALTVTGPAWTLTAADVLGQGDTVLAAVTGAGRGRVAVVGAAPGSGEAGRATTLWSALAGPTRISGEGTEWDLAQSPYQLSRLLADTEGGVPAVPWLASFLIAYIVVVGPVNGIVLGRLRRRELAWITVPAVTAVFTAAAFLGAVGGRPPLGVAARLAYWVDGFGTEVALVGVRNPTPGLRQATLPGENWLVQTLGSGRDTTVRSGEDVTARLDLPALQMGGLIGTRPLGGAAPIEVAALSGPAGLDVTVRNTSGQQLEGVVVRVGTISRSVGSLAPGAEETVSLEVTGLRPLDPYRDLLDGLTSTEYGTASPPGSLEALLRTDLLDGNPGLVWVLGQAPGSGMDVRAEDRAAEDRGTLLAVGVQPELSDQPTPLAVDRALISADSSAYRPTPLSIEGTDEVVLRYRFPAGRPVGRLYSDLDAGALVGDEADLSVWDVPDRRWVPVAEAFGPDGADPRRLLSPLGEVYVRAEQQPSVFDFSARTVSGQPPGGP
jgi:hypothetical protein